MPGPSIMVRILGDLTGLGQSMTQAAAKGTTAAGQLRGAFTGALGTLNQTGILGPFGDAIAKAQDGLAGMGAHAKSTSDKMVGLGAVGLGVGMVLQKAGSADQAAHQQLQAAVTASGHSYDQYAAKVDAAIKHQEGFGNSAVQTQTALQTLTQITGNPTKALQLLNTASDLAAAKHIDLATAAETVGKAYEGNTKVLKQFGISVTTTGSTQQQLTKATTAAQKADVSLYNAKRSLVAVQTADAASKHLSATAALHLQDAQNKVAAANLVALTAHQSLTAAQKAQASGAAANTVAMDQLSKKLSGQATAATNTFSGHMNALKVTIEDQAATLGTKYGPSLTKAGAAMAGLGSVIKVTQAAQQLLKDSTILTTIAQDAQKAATLAGTVVTQGAAAATWLWNAALDANPITLIATLIAVVLVGAIVLIVTHFNTFKAVVLDVWGTVVVAFNAIKNAIAVAVDWVAANWPLLLGILTGPIGLAIYFITSHWQSFMAFFTGLPAQIAGVAAHMWDSIVGAFKAVINSVIDVWNQLHFTLPKVDILGVHIGGETIGVPQIPHLAQGGLITQSGLIYAHAGEAITPAPANVGGPVVSVGEQHFHKEVDVDAFLRRAAWLARQRGLHPVAAPR